MIIGNFETSTGDIYSGSIGTLHGWLKIEICPISYNTKPKDPSDAKDKRPDYGVYSKGVEFGSGWRRRSAKGTDYLSIRLDSPTLPAPVDCALFLSADAESYQLVWNRDDRKAN